MASKAEANNRKKTTSLRELILYRAQSEHLLSALCPLDEILIEPRLMGKPYPMPEEVAEEQIPLTYSLVPYTPDLPQLSSRLPAQTVSIIDAIASARHIAILAPGGHGKSVALAALASRFARNETHAGRSYTGFPFYLHATDLTINNDQDILETLAAALIAAYPTQELKFIRNLIVQKVEDQEAILIVDGLDDLDPSAFQVVAAYLSKFKKLKPSIPIITTLSPSNISILPETGFALMGLAFWKSGDYKEWLNKWNTVWSDRIDTTSEQSDSIIRPSELITEWLPEPLVHTPLEWTLLVWGYFSHDLTGQSLPELMNSYLFRVTEGQFNLEKWAQFARKMVESGRITLESRWIQSTFDPKLKPVGQSDPVNSSTSSLPQSSTEYITRLQNFGLLKNAGKGEYRFIHSFISGYLAGFSDFQISDYQPLHFPQWELKSFAIGMNAVRTSNQEWLNKVIESDEPAFYYPCEYAILFNLQSITSEWKNEVLKQLNSIITRKDIAFSLRVRLLPIFWKGKPAQTIKYFQYLLTTSTQDIQRIALLGLAPYTKLQPVLDIIKPFLSDSDTSVKLTALIVFSTSTLASSLDLLMDTLISGSEVERFCAAECLAYRPDDGYSVLKETLQVEDLLIKRAGVFGLSQVREEWSEDLLRSTTILDGEWLVKNAAAQALEVITHPQLFLPSKQVPPSQSPWLIKFASKLGRGIPAGSFPMELLMQAAASSEPTYVHNALEYLSHVQDSSLQQLLQKCILNENFRIQDHASYLMLLNRLRGNS